MVLPIIAYGNPVLKKKAADITKDHPNLKEIIANMFDTMHNAKGVGLAAPQIGLSIRLFIVDASPYAKDTDEDEDEDEDEEENKKLLGFKKVFINPQIIKEEGIKWKFNEGCLSIPSIREDVERKPTVRIKYLDENFVSHQEDFDGLRARIIQHEYDHIEGVLFVDKINPLRRSLLKRKLTEISKGQVDVSYKMKFPIKK